MTIPPSSHSPSAALPRLLPSSLCPSSRPKLPCNSPLSKRPRRRIVSLRLGMEEISQLAHNKVLLASTIASAIGQLSKPFTSAINGKGIDLRPAIQSGGMPSTHSAGVVAAATSLGLERGFSDSIFGMSVVFAAFVMYDAQGVRKEVGYHAKALNKISSARESSTLVWSEDEVIMPKPEKRSINSEEPALLVSMPEEANMYRSNSGSYSYSVPASKKLGTVESCRADITEPSLEICWDCPLNESVGHTTLQVIVGALLGFAVSLAVNTVF